MKFSHFLQAVPPAPGRGDSSSPSTPVASTGADSGPGAPPGGMLGTMFPLLLILPMILVMFFTNRSQQKKQKELEDSLKEGDHVVTQSGIVGKLVEKGERYVKLEIAPGVKTRFLRTAIVGRDTGDDKAPSPSK